MQEESTDIPFEVRQSPYSKATEVAMQETRDIMSGKIEAETYESVEDFVAALDA